MGNIAPGPLDADFYFDADNVTLFPAPSQDTLDYVEALTGSPDTPLTFQTFDDSDQTRGSLAKVIHGSVWEIFRTLRELNLAGAGIFVTVNETDGLGRRAENVARVQALFVDFDETIAEPQLEPSIRVESARGEHWYWVVKDCDLSRFEPLQSLLAKVYRSDPKVKDLPRVMRLPGFAHRKGEPKHVTFRAGSGKTYSVAEIEGAHQSRLAGRSLALPAKGRNDALFERGAAWIDENLYASKDELRAQVLWLNQNFGEPLPEREIDATVMRGLSKKLQPAPVTMLADIRLGTSPTFAPRRCRRTEDCLAGNCSRARRWLSSSGDELRRRPTRRSTSRRASRRAHLSGIWRPSRRGFSSSAWRWGGERSRTG